MRKKILLQYRQYFKTALHKFKLFADFSEEKVANKQINESSLLKKITAL